MKLVLTTKRALEYEAKHGVDILEKLKEISEDESIKIKDAVDLFLVMGEDYTIDLFEEWEATFVEKAEAIINAVLVYAQGENAGK